MLCAIVMAGGKGERFWPLSTDDKPKQFLNLLGNGSMLQLTVERLTKIIPLDQIFIVTAEKYRYLVKENIPHIMERNIICEPEGKNTAPCIALSAFYIEEFYKNSTLLVVPSDHLILDEKIFLNTILQAYKYVEENDLSIVTLGVKPTRAETEYGYIKYIEGENYVKKVESFKEKPSMEKAQTYINEGNYLWNCGIFLWKSKRILELTKKYLTNTYMILKEVAVSLDGFKDRLRESYKNVDSISVDYAIMEKVDHIYVIIGQFGWDDLGNWNSLTRYKHLDSNNNVIDDNVVAVKSSNNIVKTQKKLYMMGVDNLIIVETKNEIMVLNRDDISNIKILKEHRR